MAEPVAGALSRLRPVLRLFVEARLAGEKGTTIVRRLRPHLKRPDVLAAKWMVRSDVRAALAERRSPAERLASAAEAIERRLAGIEWALNRLARPESRIRRRDRKAAKALQP